MPPVNLDGIAVREIFPGLRARIVHTERTSQSWVDIDAGAAFPEHQHPHEQVVNVLEGTLETIGRVLGSWPAPSPDDSRNRRTSQVTLRRLCRRDSSVFIVLGERCRRYDRMPVESF